MEINLVKQEDDNGCVVACLATILGRTYEQVAKEFRNDFTTKGATIRNMIDYLGDLGYSVICKSVQCYTHKDFAREEILRPFAPIHIVHLEHFVDMPQTHVVIMDADGVLHDPSEQSDADVRQSYKFREVFGIYKTYPVATEVSAPTSN